MDEAVSLVAVKTITFKKKIFTQNGKQAFVRRPLNGKKNPSEYIFAIVLALSPKEQKP